MTTHSDQHLPDDLHKDGKERITDLEREVSSLKSLADRTRMVGVLVAMMFSGGTIGAFSVRDLARDTSLRTVVLEQRITQDETALRATDVELREMRSAISRLQVLMEQMVTQLVDINRRMERSNNSWGSPSSRNPSGGPQ